MPTYARRRFDGKEWSLVEQPSPFVKPPALHTLTQAAELARRALRLSRREAPVEEIVTSHPKPWRRTELDVLPSAAQTFARWAVRQGFDVAARECGSAVQVGVARDGVLVLRATWKRTVKFEPWNGPEEAEAHGWMPPPLVIRWTAQRTVVDGRAVTLTAAKAAIS